MKRVGIITITGLGNYGNRLQNYALQQAIEKETDCKCETFINKSCSTKGYIKKMLFPVSHKLTEREVKFKEFNDEFINFSNIKINNISKNKHLLDYDCLVCGSDQIWNSDFSENDKANFGYFYPNLKVISYAASFGTDSVAKNKQKKYKKYLKNLNAISVREEKGKELVTQLSARDDAFVHIDPTLLLTSSEWMKVEKKPKIYNDKKYVLKYFLGEQNDEVNSQLENYVKKHDLEIIDVISPDSPYYNIGPSEFLYLERNAELIVTDSFHSCVFALIFKRPFIVTERKEKALKNMGSRLDTLLKKFDLENRKYDFESFKNINSKKTDFENVEKILEQEKNKSFQYFKKYI